MNTKQKGFTLIELLVVIAIIGILASVVLASLNTARNKSIDAKIKSELANARTQAALYYDTHGTYGNYPGSPSANDMCGQPDGLSDVNDSLSWLVDKTDDVGVRCTVGGGGFTYALAAKLKTGGYWCVDSTGASGLGAGDWDPDIRYGYQSQCDLISSN